MGVSGELLSVSYYEIVHSARGVIARKEIILFLNNNSHLIHVVKHIENISRQLVNRAFCKNLPRCYTALKFWRLKGSLKFVVEPLIFIK